VVKLRGEKKPYTVAAGITPSGTVHIGNFREMITVDLVARALRSLGKEVRFIYSWDDYDRLRKVPANVPKQEELKKFFGQPVTDVPDTFGCHSSYAEHMEREVSDALPIVGIKPEFIFQAKMYRACKYAEQIKEALLAREKIRQVLDKFRTEELGENWYPLNVFCEKCKTDDGRVTDYDGEYTVKYECPCGNKGSVNFKKKGIVKLPWRVDWPMRWHYEKVDFEPGGKEHSTPGGSRDTAAAIVKAVWNDEAPIYQMYDFVISKGGGKMSKSLGNAIKLTDVLQIYLPEIIRFFFAGTKPAKEFSIAMDEEIFKVYEDFYQTERIYFDKEKSSRAAHWSRVYEMSCVDGPPKEMPVQPNFKHCAELISIYGKPETALKGVKEKLSKADKERYLAILRCAKSWTEKYAPGEYRFTLNETAPDAKLTEKQRAALRELGEEIFNADNEDELVEIFKEIAKGNGLETKDFFRACYLVLIGRERGPRLAPFIMAADREKIAKLLQHL
jgi:lysyl-tRNA synthetase class 1